jgi:hypothetical protein
MNQTHQRWAYRSALLQALIESTAHNKNAGSSCAVEATAWSGLSGQSSIARGTNSFSWKTVLSHTRKEIVFHRKQFFLYQLHSIISEKRLLRNTFAIEGVFLAMLDDVSMSLASANRHKG